MNGSPPDVSILNVFAQLPSTQAVTISELVDNSLDANARHVSLGRPTRSLITISDDGHGIRDIIDAVTLAKHIPEDTKPDRLGRWGWGLPFCLAWWGYRWHITTTREGVTSELKIESAGDIGPGWEYPNVQTSPANGHVGTTIAITNTARSSVQWKQIAKELSWVFAPAILNGTVIDMKNDKAAPLTLKPLRLPPMFSKVTGTVTFEDGRSAKYSAGHIKQDLPMVGGGGCCWVSFSHRNLAACNLGCGEFSALDFAAYIALSNAPDGDAKDGWKLDANKTGIDDDQEAELSDVLESLFRPVLENIAAKPEVLEIDKIRGELNEKKIGGETGQEKRDEGDSTGTSEPKGTGRRRRIARRYDPAKDGSVDVNGKAEFVSPKRLTYDFKRFDDKKISGEFDSRTCTIFLNRNHTGIKAMADSGRKRELWLIAAGLVASTHNPGSSILFNKHASAEEVLGTLVDAIVRDEK
jgi:hypothetical protein